MLGVTRILFPFWVERALLRTLPQRATERAFHQDIKGEALEY
jgi:hypothetical protein